MAVLPLQPVGISSLHASALTDRLGEELLRIGAFTLVDRSQIEAILDEQAFQQSGCTEQECAVQVGRILGVRMMVAGKVTLIENDLWLLSAILVDVETSQTLAAESVRHAGGYLQLLDEGIAVLASKLAEASRLSTGMTRAPGQAPMTTTPPMASAQTPPAENSQGIAVPPTSTQSTSAGPNDTSQTAASGAEPGGGTAAVLFGYASAGVLGTYAVVMYAQALEEHQLAKSTAESDPASSRQYEDERDKDARIALIAGLAAAGALVWAISRDEVPGTAEVRPPSMFVGIWPSRGRPVLLAALRW